MIVVALLVIVLALVSLASTLHTVGELRSGRASTSSVADWLGVTDPLAVDAVCGPPDAFGRHETYGWSNFPRSWRTKLLANPVIDLALIGCGIGALVAADADVAWRWLAPALVWTVGAWGAAIASLRGSTALAIPLSQIAHVPLGAARAEVERAWGAPILGQSTDAGVLLRVSPHRDVVADVTLLDGGVHRIVFTSARAHPHDVRTVLLRYAEGQAWDDVELGYLLRRADGEVWVTCSAAPIVGVHTARMMERSRRPVEADAR